jgi:hypothetical protein
VAHTPRLHVEQLAAVGLQRVADVAECGAVGQDDLPQAIAINAMLLALAALVAWGRFGPDAF